MRPMRKDVLATRIIHGPVRGECFRPVVARVVEQVMTEDTVLAGYALIDPPVGIQSAKGRRVIGIPIQASDAVVRKRHPLLEDTAVDRADPAGWDLVIRKSYACERILDDHWKNTLALRGGRHACQRRSNSLDNP